MNAIQLLTYTTHGHRKKYLNCNASYYYLLRLHPLYMC